MNGFTLVEVLVASFVIAILAIGITGAAALLTRVSAESEQQVVAVELANQHIEYLRAQNFNDIGQETSPSLTINRNGRPFTLTVNVADLEKLKQVKVEVAWQSFANRERQIALHTLIASMPDPEEDTSAFAPPAALAPADLSAPTLPNLLPLSPTGSTPGANPQPANSSPPPSSSSGCSVNDVNTIVSRATVPNGSSRATSSFLIGGKKECEYTFEVSWVYHVQNHKSSAGAFFTPHCVQNPIDVSCKNAYGRPSDPHWTIITSDTPGFYPWKPTYPGGSVQTTRERMSGYTAHHAPEGHYFEKTLRPIAAKRISGR